MMQSIGEYEYGLANLIGHGAFALVFKGQHKPSGRPVAVKQILLKNIPGKLSSISQKEISILKDLKHPNIVQLYNYHETRNEIYLIMEFCNGGDLAQYLQDKMTLSEDSIRHLAIHIAKALCTVHKRNIIHRDIKPQNLLLSYPSNKSGSLQIKDAMIKLADFGFARYLSGADMAVTLCGSPLYMAPEILLGHPYHSKVDLWSTGTILFQCLDGKAPFLAPSPHALKRRYERETLIPKIPEGTSYLLKDLLLNLLRKKPQDRLSQDEFLSHQFLQRQDCIQTKVLEDSPSLHAKSCPVPIQRQQSSTQSGYTTHSPRSSPRTGREQTSLNGQKYFSPSSGPPTLHNIGSNSSLPHYCAPSPPTTNDTDEGFVLISSLSKTDPPSFHGSNSSQESSSSHTLSSLGSLTHQFVSPLSQPHPPNLISASSHSTQTSHFKRQDTPPFSSLIKLGGASISSSPSGNATKLSPISYQTTPSFQASPSSSSSSPIIRFQGSPGSGKRSLPGSRQDSYNKLSVLFESKRELAPQLVDSTDLISHSLLMGTEHLQRSNKFGLKTPEPDNTSLIKSNSPLFHVGGEEGQGDESLGPLQDTGEEMFSFQMDETDNDRYLHGLKESTLIAQELLKLAKSRQGPMLLLSSSMGDSSGMLDHAHRFSEQLVLCVKAANVIEDGCKKYEISLAVSSMEPQTIHSTVFDEAKELQEICLEKAQLARELYFKCTSKQQRQPLPQTKVTAERLIFLQAVDLCKQAVLEESTPRKHECIRRYRISLILLQLLLSDAKSDNDQNILQKYINCVESRLKLLSTHH